MRKASGLAREIVHCGCGRSYTGRGLHETDCAADYGPDITRAITEARLEVVARLREMAERWAHDTDLEMRAYYPSALRDAADKLELEVREAGA